MKNMVFGALALLTMAGAACADVTVGMAAPDFALPDQKNVTHKLADEKGKWVVLAFYPADMTPGCTLEARSLNQALTEFGKRGAQVFGVSVQDVASKQKFCELEGLTYPLLADVSKQTAKDYGVLQERGVAKRVTFLIGPDGKVAAVDRKVNTRGHAQDVLAWLDAFKSNKVELDKPVAPFTLPDAAEKSVTIGDWAADDTKATVVLFVGTECSVVRAYAPRIKALAEGYAAKGVRVVGINANAGEKPARMAVGAKAYGWEFPVLKDATNAISDRFGATKTPEAFVVDASGILRYHGRIDDNAQEADVKSRDLQNALDAILAGQPVTTKQTAVDGCGIRKGPPKDIQ